MNYGKFAVERFIKPKYMKVGIVMGSISDWPVMIEAEKILNQFGIETDKRVLSAHRTPRELEEWVKNSAANGVKVIIAGAGGAAHLAGVVAAFTTMPVIGVPVKSHSLEGLDSLLSMVQMPPGIPVATVGINGAKNAGLLAAEILSVASEEIRKKMVDFRESQARKVLDTKFPE